MAALNHLIDRLAQQGIIPVEEARRLRGPCYRDLLSVLERQGVLSASERETLWSQPLNELVSLLTSKNLMQPRGSVDVKMTGGCNPF